MQEEIAEQADLFAAWATGGGHAEPAVLEDIRRFRPHTVLTVARGSSHRAAEYGKYLFEILLGVPTGSTSPSAVTLFGSVPKAAGVLAVSVSQSGESPDIVAEAEALRRGGALIVAITNAPESPLAKVAHHVVSLDAGPELAVAATKSFTAQCAALSDLAFGWAGRRLDRQAVADAVRAATRSSFPVEAVEVLAQPVDRTRFLLAIGRGPSAPIAAEGALKIMETSAIPALGYSAADFAHGPRAVIGRGVPVILVVPPGRASASVASLAVDLAYQGATVVALGPVPEARLVMPEVACDELLAPIAQAVHLQRMAWHLSVMRGLDPDSPPNLTKVTRTV